MFDEDSESRYDDDSAVGDDAAFAGRRANAGDDACEGVGPVEDDDDRWGPDALDEVVEVAVMQAVFAAQQFIRVDRMRSEARADAERAGRRMTDVVERGIRLELAAALRITEYTAGALIGHAEALLHRYPTALDALAGGRITVRHAEMLVDMLDELEPHLRDRLVTRAVELAETHPVGVFRRRLRALVDDSRVETLAERHAEALKSRRVVVEPAEDGMAWLMSFMPVVEAHAGMNRITEMSRRILAREGETRSLDQVRADVLGDLLVDGDTADLPGEARGIRASVVVTVPVLALLHDGSETAAADEPDHGGYVNAGNSGFDGAAGASRPEDAGVGRSGSAGLGLDDPPVVEGIGPIPLDRARELCGGADGWTRVLTHPETGMVLSVGREKYRPPPGLRRLVRWRADRCMAPGCSVPASRCEIDPPHPLLHPPLRDGRSLGGRGPNVAWEHGGHTSLDNHCPLCKGHHLVKHHGGWTVQQLPGGGGAIEWTSPARRRYVVHPERRVPTFTTTAAQRTPGTTAEHARRGDAPPF